MANKKTNKKNVKKMDKKPETAKKSTGVLGGGDIAFIIVALVLSFTSVLFFIAGGKGIEDAPLIAIFCKVVYGLFGYAAFSIVPVLLYEAVKWKENVIRRTCTLRLVSGLLFVTFLAVTVHSVMAVFGAAEATLSLSTLVGNGDISGGGVFGGGLLGGILYFGLYKLLGYHAIIIIFSLALLCVSAGVFFRISPYKIYRRIKAMVPELSEEEKEQRRKDRLAEKERLEKEREALERAEREKEEALVREREEKAAKKRLLELEREEAERKKREEEQKKEESKIDFDFDDKKKDEDKQKDSETHYEDGTRSVIIGETLPKKKESERKVNITRKTEQEISEDTGSGKDERGESDKNEAHEKDDKGVDYEDIEIYSVFNDKGSSGKSSIDPSVFTEDKKGEVYGTDSDDTSDADADASLTDSDEDDEDFVFPGLPEETKEEKEEYVFPPIDLLAKSPENAECVSRDELIATAEKLVSVLASFKVDATVVNISQGPTVTRYELVPRAGIRVRQITNLVDDIALNLGVSGIRMEAPIPGKAAIGIEVPNRVVASVNLRDIIEDEAFRSSKSKCTACLGKDVAGAPVIMDIAKMPHLLVAGATGQGKSVSLNSIIISLLYKASPRDLKLILVDPKKVEMAPYNSLPHLMIPVVSSPKKAAGALASAVTEMERRFELIESMGVRDIKSYNDAISGDPAKEYLPHIVIIIDELNDLMVTARDTVEDSITRIAQKARAAGIHLIVCTQRPSVDVITGVIKANIPSRIAFTVTSVVDSRTILDVAGAEKLCGRGDMLFSPVGARKPIRAQGAFVSDDEVEAITTFIKEQSSKVKYNDDFIKLVNEAAERCDNPKGGAQESQSSDSGEMDPKFWDACDIAYEMGEISTSSLQRRLSLGYGRAAKLIDIMQSMGIVGPKDGQKARALTMSREEYLTLRMRGAEGGNRSDDEDDGTGLE